MDNAMNNADRAEQITERVRDLEERLSAWVEVATGNQPEREKARMVRTVETYLAEVRAPLDYREHLSELRAAFQSATDDGALIQRLYEEIFLRSAV